jgi:hypothetical protein
MARSNRSPCMSSQAASIQLRTERVNVTMPGSDIARPPPFDAIWFHPRPWLRRINTGVSQSGAGTTVSRMPSPCVRARGRSADLRACDSGAVQTIAHCLACLVPGSIRVPLSEASRSPWLMHY